MVAPGSVPRLSQLQPRRRPVGELAAAAPGNLPGRHERRNRAPSGHVASAIATSCPLGHHHPPALDSRAIGPPDPESVGPSAHAPARAAIPPKRSHDHAQHPEHQSRPPLRRLQRPRRHNVAASNCQTYSYCYTGGDDGAGGLYQTVGQSRDTAPLQLVADQRYQINSCEFTDYTQNQLSWSGNGNRAGSIIDPNSQVETAKYSICVIDTGNGNCTVRCDPPIKNIPPA